MKDIAVLVGGFLSALLFFLGTIGIQFDWFTQDSIDAFAVLVTAAIALIVNLVAVVRNTYVTKKEKEQASLLERNNLK